jgi:hypothetical protein
MPQLINFVGFQLLWLACVISAGMNMQWLGLLTGCIVLAWHLYSASNRWHAFKLLCCVVCLGCVFDELLLLSELLRFSHWQAVILPPWMAMLWLGFASTLNVSLRWMHSKYWMGALFGAIGGPLSYMAAERLGAIAIQQQLLLIVLAAGWAIMMPAMLWLASKFNGFEATSPLNQQ